MMHYVTWTRRYAMFVLPLLILVAGCVWPIHPGDGQAVRDDDDGYVSARRSLSLSDLLPLYGAVGQGMCALISRSIRLGLLFDYFYGENGAFPGTIDELNAFIHTEQLPCDISEIIAIREITLNGADISFEVETVYGEISGRVERCALSQDAFIEAWEWLDEMESACKLTH